MTEPMHKHEMLDHLWDFERPFMTQQEVVDWAERGFRAYLDELPEAELKARYAHLMRFSSNFTDEVLENEM
jgi:hypothetical protein